MRQLNDKNRRDVFLELMMDELKIIREYLEQLAPVKRDVAVLKEDMAEVKSDIRAIKAAITDQGKQVHDHEVRITRLENAPSHA
jgi:hypothetical protein